MLYLIKSFGRDGKSILKIGYTDDLNRRMSQYFYNNPCFELIATREGDELLEDMIQVYLKSLGYQYQRSGRLNEWFIDTPEIYQIFHIYQEKLERVGAIYKKLGIKSTAKAIDILNWFEVKEIRIATIEGKRDHGFEIIALKK